MKSASWMKKAVYLVGALALLAGLWGFYSRFAFGERDVNYGSYVTWGLWVAMYMFFGGIAAGATMMAALDILLRVPQFRGLGRPALWAGLVTLGAALVSIAMDLGHMGRVWKVFVNPNFRSVMAQLVWGYSIFFVILLALLLMLWRRDNRSPFVIALMAVAVVIAVLLSGGVGALLGVNANRVSWHVSLLPAQFPVFALASGVALMLIVVGWLVPNSDRRPAVLRVLSLGLVVLLVIKAYLLWSDISLAFASGVPESVASARAVMFGRWSWAFWGLQVGLGLVVPVIVLTVQRLARHAEIAGLMGVFVLVGMAVSRANIIFPALTLAELQGLATAFTGPHLNLDYAPSLMEWSVTLGVVGAASLVFLVGLDLLQRQAQEVG